jgi:hypothetical protein
MTPLPLIAVIAPVVDVHGHRPDTRAERSCYDLATLTPADARSLVGKRARFRVVLDSTGDDSFDCVAPDGLHATVYLVPDQEVADEMVVEARLVIIDHPASFGFAALREYRLVDAVVRVGREAFARPGAAGAILGTRQGWFDWRGRRSGPVRSVQYHGRGLVAPAFYPAGAAGSAGARYRPLPPIPAALPAPPPTGPGRTRTARPRNGHPSLRSPVGMPPFSAVVQHGACLDSRVATNSFSITSKSSFSGLE